MKDLWLLVLRKWMLALQWAESLVWDAIESQTILLRDFILYPEIIMEWSGLN
jgi:hypothetical protein